MKGAEGRAVEVEREALPAFADAVTARLRRFESGRDFTAARYGDDWGVSFEPVNERSVSARFEAHTTAGAVYLAELNNAGFFDREIG